MKPALQTRLAAFWVLKDIFERKVTVQLAFSKCKLFKQFSEIDAKFVRLLVLTTLRRYGQSKILLNQYLKKKLSGKKKDIELVLILAIVQLKFLNTPAHAVVDTSVELSKEIRQKHFSGLVNAILHAMSKDKDRPLPDIIENLPTWLRQKWLSVYSKEQVSGFVKMFNTEPVLDISVRKDASLWAQKLGGELLPTGTVRCHFTENVPSLEGFEEGAWWVQEASAALPALLFSDVEGKKGADLCSAPGGKTAQLVMRGATVDAYDISEKRLEKLKENMTRLNISEKVTIVCKDALQIDAKGQYDFILLDAPCSATGTIKRHPDLMYLRQEEDIYRLAQMQKELLEQAVRLLKKGGELVYSTCSLECEENETLVQAFLKEHINIKRVPIQLECLKPFLNESGAVQVLPGGNVLQDGFYAVLLKKE